MLTMCISEVHRLLFLLCILEVILIAAQPPFGCPFFSPHHHPQHGRITRQQSSAVKRRSTDNTQVGGSTSCTPQNQHCDPKSIYYSYDGSCNNLHNPSWGQSETQFNRLMPANYADSKCSLRKASNGYDLSLARFIRTTMLEDREAPSQKYNILYYGFGQWIDHDVAAAQPMLIEKSCCTNGRRDKSRPESCLPIVIPEKDTFYSQFKVTCLDLKRVNNSHTLKCNLDKPCSPINFQTGMFDLSVLYGPNSKIVNDLRLFRGGLLKFTNDSMTKYQLFPPIVRGVENCPLGGIDNQAGGYCWKTGDVRIPQNPELTVIELIFYKLHQLTAAAAGASKVSDEKIFQETRRYLIAVYQHIIYSEFVPITIGHQAASNFDLLPREQGHALYKPHVSVQTLAEFSFAVGRAPHSLIKGFVRYRETDTTTSYLLRNKYFNQRFLLERNIFEYLLRSYMYTDSNAQDDYGSEEINNYLRFNRTNGYGSDLQAIDILRGLDAGLPTYNTVRSKLGLRKLRQFKDLEGEISNNAAISKLKLVYATVDDIDLYIGGLLEKPVHDSSFGPTFTRLLAESYYRWKFGDRLFYEFAESGFSSDELKEIRKFTFAYLLCLVNPGHRVPKNAFLIPSPSNPLIDCHDVLQNGPRLKIWKSVASAKYRG